MQCRAATDIDEITRSHRWSLYELQEEKLRFQSRWYQFLQQGAPFYSLGIIGDEGLSVTEFKSCLTGERPFDFVEDIAFKHFPTTFDSQQLAVTLQV